MLENSNLRKIIINPENEEENPYVSNEIKTSKYTIWNFVPLFLLYFYSNYFNLYFLIVTIILSIKSISTMSWTIGVIPYLVVIAMSVFREGFEDYKKYSNDKEFNNSKSQIYNSKTKKFEEIFWKDMKVGKIVKLIRNESIPCDVLIIKTSNENGLSYLETSNLDGESALKPRECFNYINLENYNQFEIHIDKPNKNIYQIDGFVIENNNINEKKFFNNSHILLRGGTLKNVDYIYGIIIYSGNDTKLMQNINNSNYKHSYIEITENKIVIYVMLFTFILCIGGAFAAIYEHRWLRKNNAFYLFSNNPNKKYNDIKEGFKYFGIYFLIFQNITPICLMIALEVVKLAQVFFMSFDKELYPDKDDKLKILAFRIHDDLGNIKYIFSDKTGTLTRNEMLFKACSINTILYQGDIDSKGNIKSKKKKKSFFERKFNENIIIQALKNEENLEKSELNYIKKIKDSVKFFFLNIVLNHSVLTENNDKNNEIIYQGTNPDELTLVQASGEIGIKFIERKNNNIKLEILGKIENWELLERFEFTSSRLRSSIIVKEPNLNKIFLFMKGADSVILSEENLTKFSYENIVPKTKEHLDNFARNGYRTLCFSMRELNKKEYENFKIKYSSLKTKFLSDKSLEKDLEDLISQIEKNMILQGATSLEDKLQKGVNKTIQDLIDAGIHVWMLTGDKMDTAQSIAYSCKLFNDDTDIFKIKKSDSDKDEILEEKLKDINSKMSNIDNYDDKGENKLNIVKKEMKYTPNLKKIESAHVNFENDIQKELEPQSKEDIMKLKNALSNNIDDNNLNKNENLHLNNNKIHSGKIKLKPIENNKTQNSNNLILNNNKTENNIKTDYIKFDRDNKRYDTHNSKISLNNSQIHRPSQSNVMSFLVNSNFFNRNNKKESTIVSHAPSIANTNLAQIDQSSSIEMENSINSIINDIIDNNKKNNNENYNNNNADIFQSETIVDDYRNKITNRLNVIEENDKKKNPHFNKRDSNIQSEIIFSTKKENNPNQNIQIIQNKNNGLIIEGISITKCITNPEIQDLFIEIISKCRTVVCSRCSPIQKSEMVSFIKKNTSHLGFSTLAIGDGGNDVNMIKEASIGIGLFGKEGYQAAFNSDYAISKFKYLSRLLFYHGRFSLMRNSYFILYFFYKSILYAMPHFWLLFYNGYSSAIIYDDAQFLIYNALGSNLVIGIYTALEEDIDMNFTNYPNKEEVKTLMPDIYRNYRESRPFTILRFVIWALFALFHTAMIFFIPYLCLKYDIISSDGESPDYWTYSLICYWNIIMYQTILIITDSWYFSLFTIIVYAVHILCNFLTVFIRNYVKTDQCAGITVPLFGTWKYWFIIFLTFAIGYLPYFIWSKFKLFFVYDIVNELRYGKYKFKIERKKFRKKLKQANKLKKLILKFQNMYEKDDINNINENNVMDKQVAELVKKYKKIQEEIENQDHVSINNDNEEQNNNNQHEMNVNNPIVFDYPEFLEEPNYNNNKDIITDSSIEEDDQEDFIDFVGDNSENKENNFDNSTTNN